MEDKPPLLLCKDCKHCGYNVPTDPPGGYYTLACVPCHRIPPEVGINLVNGDKYTVHQLFCRMERKSHEIDACGSKGKFFEARVFSGLLVA